MGQGKRALFIGAHNDDCEYAAGGTAYMLRQRGYDTYFLNVACKRHEPLDEATITVEERQEMLAAEVLGASKLIIGDRSSSAYYHTQENAYAIECEVARIEPEIVFIHWPRDNHIEHAAAARNSIDGLCTAWVHGVKVREVYAFEAGPSQSMLYFKPDFYVMLEREAVEKVRQSLYVFDQEHAQGEWLWKEKEVSARFRGHMAGCEYAEAFKIIKFPHGTDDPELLVPKLFKGRFRWEGNGMYPWGRHYFFE